LGLSLFLLPDGRHSSTLFGSLPSSILHNPNDIGDE
jgi:hypothetical protein